MKEVYDNYDFLKKLTNKRFSDAVLADEAFSFAFEALTQDDWHRVRLYKGTSSLKSYLGCIWCRLLEDFFRKKYGKITPPVWIQNLGGVWEELFILLCRKRFTPGESIQKIQGDGKHIWNEKDLEKAIDEIYAKIPNCGKQTGPAYSLDDEPGMVTTDMAFNGKNMNPGEITIRKERWVALQAMARVCFKQQDEDSEEDIDTEKLAGLVNKIQKHLHLSEMEQLILITHFVDGESISDIGRRLGLNTNQIHGQFRRLMDRIKKTLPDLLKPYI